jgi:DNA-binding NarL/FixJ family response regulator
MAGTRVVVADDDVLLREGLASLLSRSGLEVVGQAGDGTELVSARRRNDPLEALSSREREVLALMAEGLSNSGIGRRIYVTEGTVEKHVRSILTKLDLPETNDDHRRVRAVIVYLESL